MENNYLLEKNGAEDLFEGLLPLKIEEYVFVVDKPQVLFTMEIKC